MTKATDGDAVKASAGLFEDLPEASEAQVQEARAQRESQRSLGEPRLLVPNRAQVELRASDLESLLPEDHRARLVWGYVERQDRSALLDGIKARGAASGRRAIDPRILFALWLYAMLDGVGSGREVTRLSREHDAYRWICGGVQVNYHALNDFRSANDKVLDELLSANVATLAEVGAIKLERVAQDGMRVRADAGAASFRRQGRLEEHLAEARELVRNRKAQVEADPAEAKRRSQAAKLRAAQQREECIGEALARLPEVAATKRRNGGKADEARASSTDADASVMKMGDGGFRPAYNVQFATDCEGQVIVGMDVVTAGSDMAQLAPILDHPAIQIASQIDQRRGAATDRLAIDHPVLWCAQRHRQPGGFDRRQHLRPEHLGQRLLVEQIAACAAVALLAPLGAPSAALGVERSRRNDEVGMRVIVQPAGAGVQHRDGPRGALQLFVILAERTQRLPPAAQQQVVDHCLIRPGQRP